MSLYAKTVLPQRQKLKSPEVKPTIYPEYWNQVLVPASEIFKTKPILQYSNYSYFAQEETTQQHKQEIQTIPLSQQDLMQSIEKERSNTAFYQGFTLGAFSMFGFMMVLGLVAILMERKKHESF